MPKNIVICCDGTSNEPAHDMTNVAKLYFCLKNAPEAQITYFHPGLGTMEPPGALTPWQKWVTRTLGLALGRGIQDDIRDAYVFLADTFCPGDRVYLFGFSRGAYTARALTGLLAMYGLIEPGNSTLVPYAIRMMFAINKAHERNDDKAANEVFALARRFRDTYSRECKPHFVGLWDTVSSVGWFAHPVHLPYTANSPDISIARHALALDERRAFFHANIWRPSPHQPSGPRDLRQVWFPGSHSDVGGGYPEGPESAQSKYPLEWMLVEARKAGLLIDQAKADEILGKTPNSRYVAAGFHRKLHNSLTGLWCLAEFILKPHFDYATEKSYLRANLFRRREFPPALLVHASAYNRDPPYPSTIPPGAIRVEHEELLPGATNQE